MKIEPEKLNWHELSELKKQYLDYNFGGLREVFEVFDDERKEFCTIYDMLLKACDEMATVDNNLIWIAFNQLFDDGFNQLQFIAGRFIR